MQYKTAMYNLEQLSKEAGIFSFLGNKAKSLWDDIASVFKRRGAGARSVVQPTAASTENAIKDWVLATPSVPSEVRYMPGGEYTGGGPVGRFVNRLRQAQQEKELLSNSAAALEEALLDEIARAGKNKELFMLANQAKRQTAQRLAQTEGNLNEAVQALVGANRKAYRRKELFTAANKAKRQFRNQLAATEGKANKWREEALDAMSAAGRYQKGYEKTMEIAKRQRQALKRVPYMVAGAGIAGLGAGRYLLGRGAAQGIGQNELLRNVLLAGLGGAGLGAGAAMLSHDERK